MAKNKAGCPICQVPGLLPRRDGTAEIPFAYSPVYPRKQVIHYAPLANAAALGKNAARIHAAVDKATTEMNGLLKLTDRDLRLQKSNLADSEVQIGVQLNLVTPDGDRVQADTQNLRDVARGKLIRPIIRSQISFDEDVADLTDEQLKLIALHELFHVLGVDDIDMSDTVLSVTSIMQHDRTTLFPPTPCDIMMLRASVAR